MPQFRPMLPCSAQMARQKAFAVDKAMDYKAGRLVSVNVSEGSVTIKSTDRKRIPAVR